MVRGEGEDAITCCWREHEAPSQSDVSVAVLVAGISGGFICKLPTGSPAGLTGTVTKSGFRAAGRVWSHSRENCAKANERMIVGVTPELR
jgi:hypothetical protein